MFEIMAGMNSGLTFLGPPSTSLPTSRSKTSSPPMPDPKQQAKRVRSSSSRQMPDCARASSAATMANWTKRAKRRASFFEKCSSGSKPGI